MNVADIKNFFTAADINHNGYLTASEFKKAISSQTTGIQKTLSSFLNEKGKINSAAFNAVAGDDKKMTQEELLSLLTTTDEDDNVKVLDDDALETQYNNIATATTLDANGDGKISTSEILKAYNNASADSDIKKLLANFVETNTKGKLQVNKSKLKVLSGGKNYITYQDLLKTDTDSSGMASSDELSAYLKSSSSFTTVDANGDGKLSSKEILNAYNSAASGSELKALLASFVSTNNKGKLQVNTSKIKLLSGGKNYVTFSDLLKADSDSDGTPSATEVKKYLSSFEEFCVLDINGDGKTTLAEMKKYAKTVKDSNLANYIYSLASSKEMKRVFKILSNGKNYLTAEDIAKYDTNKNGVICSEELAAFKKVANGIVDASKT